jgi:8-hydroxy-5-deazaflavin:NADPH oxidoreductase
VGLLAELGWRRDQVLDLGGLGAARGMEAYLLFWVSVLGAVGTPRFNVRIVR